MSDDEFVDRYFDLVLALGHERGFGHATGVMPPKVRRGQVANRRDVAIHAIRDLQQWLCDGDPIVAGYARTALQRCMYVAYTGDQHGTDYRRHGLVGAPVKLLHKYLALDASSGPDAPARQRRWLGQVDPRPVRAAATALAFVGALVSASLFAAGLNTAALVAAVVAVIFDVFEYAFADAIKHRSPFIRWLSCLAGNASDIAILTGIAYHHLHESDPNGMLLGGVVLATLFGSFVRVSALQAGYRFWRSPYERIFRFVGVVAYVVLAALGYEQGSVVALSGAVLGFTVLEVLRVLVETGRSRPQDGGMLILSHDGTADTFSFVEPGAGAIPTWRESILEHRAARPSRGGD